MSGGGEEREKERWAVLWGAFYVSWKARGLNAVGKGEKGTRDRGEGAWRETKARVAQIEAEIKTSGEIKVSMLINLNSSGVAADKGILAAEESAHRRDA